MKKVETFDRNRRSVFLITLTGFCLGLLYPVLADSFENPVAFLNGIMIGTIGGFLVSVIEVYLFGAVRKKISFLTIVTVKIVVYFLLFVFLILSIMNINEGWYYGLGVFENFRSERFQSFLREGDFRIILLYALILVAIIIFTKQLSRKMGQGILFNFISGKYHKPREEERIFMFLDLKSSTALAERFSMMEYYNLLNDFFFDITPAILHSHGEVYRYVGDQVVVSWSEKKGLRNANCLRCFFSILDEMENQKEKYLGKYRFVPSFRASLHCGKVITGEIGNIKSQIVFHGEPLYTTANIEQLCRKFNKSILVSATLIQRLSLPVIFNMKFVTNLKMEGTNQDLALYTVEEAELAAA